MIPGTNNLGNIKNMAGGGVAATDNMNGSRDKYRQYTTPADFADDFASLIQRKHPGAMGAGADVTKFAEALKAGGYAEDPRYVDKVAQAARMSRTAPGPLASAAERAVSAVLPSAQAAQAKRGGMFADLLAAKPAEPSYDPTEGMNSGEKFLAGAGKFLADSARGLKQNLLDEPAAALERMMPWSAGISQAIGGKTAAQIAQEARAQSAESKRLDAPLMRTGAGIAGNLAGGLAVAPLAAPLGAIGGGMLMGAAEPTTQGGGEALKNMAIGGATGYAGDKVLKGLSRVIQPKVNPNVRALMDEGITPTPGQIMGGNLAKLEAKSTSIPILGDAIAKAQGRAGAQLNTAAFNRALAPIGEKLPLGVTGNDAVEFVGQKLGKAYDNLLPKLTTQMDQQFTQDIGALRESVQAGALDPKYPALFERTIDTRLMNKFQGQQAMTGETVKSVESFLGSEIKRFAQSQDPDARLLGDAYAQVQSNLRDLLARTNPEHASELQAINSGWANFKRVQKASGAIGADEGVFTAAQLQNAVKASDRSKDKARFAEGNALMQDLSGPAKSVLGSKYGDSGTAGRMMNAGALASGLVNPAIPAGLLGGAALYSPTAQKLIAGLLTQRSGGAGLLADRVRSAAPIGGLLAADGALLLDN